MILLDANLLIYAYDRSSPFHHATREWIERTIESEPVIGMPWIRHSLSFASLRIPACSRPKASD